jgi:hypothetical protein
MESTKYKFMKKRLNILIIREDLNIKTKLKRFNKSDIDYIIKNEELMLEFVFMLLTNEGVDGMWKGRSTVFFSSFLPPFYQLIKECRIKTSPSLIRNSLGIDTVLEICEESNLKTQTSSLDEFLHNLPGFVVGLPYEEQHSATMEQHGYISMQITYVLDVIIEHFNYEKEDSISFKGLKIKNKLENF